MKWSSFLFTATALTFAGTNADAQAANEVVLAADNIAETADGDLITATGQVEATYGTRILRADRVIYDRRTGKVRATGNVSITEEDGSIRFADEIEVNETLDDGYAVGFSTRLPERGVASANSAVRQANGVSALDQAVYTACEVCEEKGIRPTWALRARRAVLDEDNDIISYRDAVLEIVGIPVLYLPYFFHPDPTSGRRSGFLVPSIGGSTRLGATYSQPYHRVLSPSSDLTVTPSFFTKVRPLLEAEYRKRFWSGDLNIAGSFTFERDFNNDGERFGEEKVRGHIFADGDFKVNDTWSWGFGVERASDDLFTRRYSIDGANVRRGIFEAQPRVLLSQLYAVGQTDTFYTDTSLLFFQDLRADSTQVPTEPITTPLIFSEKLFDLGKYGRFNLQASSAVLNRNPNDGVTPDINPDSRRVSIGAEWGTTRILPGGVVVEPFADVRGDYYDLDPLASGENTVIRAVGSVGSKVSWPIARNGKNVDILIEPTVLGAWGLSNVNNDAIPVEDSLLAEFDDTRLFESNGFGNFDLYEGDARLSAGVTTRVNFRSGPTIDLIAGRRWRSRVDDAFDAASNLNGTSSDWVGSLSADFGPYLQVDTRVRIDSDGLALNRFDTRASTRFWRIRASARYFRIDEDIRPGVETPDEGFQVRTQFRLTDHYSVLYSQLRDITDQRDNSRRFGLIYQDDCSRFQIVYTRSETLDRTIGSNDSIRFSFTLATLGNFASN